jgi:sec-independent protein translocase protein TatB
MFFDFGAGEFIGLAVLAMILVGPERLPKLASEAASLVRKIQKLTQSATAELRENLGPGFEDLQPSDLNPKTFLKKQLTEALEDKSSSASDSTDGPQLRIDPDLL